MSDTKRNRMPPERIVETAVATEGECVLPIFPVGRFVKAIRLALDGGQGRLRMDPQELANRLGGLIDFEVGRLARVRERRKRKERERTARLMRGHGNHEG
jgi:hypothetical protein